MDFGKYIHELLLENEIVIIPGFGAFVSEYKPAEISEDSDEIKPPSKTVLFNQQIRNNDGLLVGFVSEKRRISHFDALKQIEKERENILYKLDSGEEVELAEVGVLVYTTENTIGFKPVQDENMLLDSFGLETTSILESEDETPAEEPVITPVVEEEKTDEQIPEENINTIETNAAEEESEKEPAWVATTEPLIADPEEEKKKKGWWWLLLVLIPLIGVSVYIFMKGENPRETHKIEKQESTISPIQKPEIFAQDTLKTDSVTIAEKDTIIAEPAQEEPKAEIESNTPKYYLVGGSFSVEENAETYLKELQAKGYDAFHAGKKGRFFIIGIGTFDTFNEADQAKTEYMENNSGSEVWVWKK